MGKYRAQMSLPNHLFGTIREYDDDHPVVRHRVSSGMLVRVDGDEAKPEKPKAKQSARKRKATVKPNPEPEVEVEDSAAPSATFAPDVTEDAPSAAKSSVQTSWTVSD